MVRCFWCIFRLLNCPARTRPNLGHFWWVSDLNSHDGVARCTPYEAAILKTDAVLDLVPVIEDVQDLTNHKGRLKAWLVVDPLALAVVRLIQLPAELFHIRGQLLNLRQGHTEYVQRERPYIVNGLSLVPDTLNYRVRRFDRGVVGRIFLPVLRGRLGHGSWGAK